MIASALGRISRIAFSTDMTRANAPEIPLGFMIEAVWPGEARWLGMIGRTRLTPIELERIDLNTWRLLEKPFDLLDQFFDQGWAAAWGEAGISNQNTWSRSALEVGTEDHPEVIADLAIDSAEAWTAACNALFVKLDEFQARLVPTIKPAGDLCLPVRPARGGPQPIASRTETDVPLAA